MKRKHIIAPDKWSKVDFNNPEHVRKVYGAVQHFMTEMESDHMRSSDEIASMNAISQAIRENFRGGAQNFTAEKFPDAVLEIARRFQQTEYTSANWTEFFDVLDYTSGNKNGFQILDVSAGLTFKQVPIGQKIQLYGFTGEKATVNFERFGGGMGWDRTLIDDREYLSLDMIAQAFTLNALNQKNELMFAMLNSMLTGGANAGSIDEIAWQAPIPATLANTNDNYTAIRDMETISKAAHTLINANKGKGYGVTESSQVVLMFSPYLRSRVLRALGVLNSGISNEYRSVMWNVKPVMAVDLNSTSEWLMGIPGKKTLFGNRMNLTVFNKFDPSSYSDAAYGWMRYGAAIGDFDQFVRGKTS